MEFCEKLEIFNKPIIQEKNYSLSNHKIFQKYSSPIYHKYSLELLNTLCKNSSFENKSKIFHKSIYFLLKFLYKSKNDILIPNFDLIILISFYLGIKTVENQKIIPNLTKLKNIYKDKFGEYKNKDIKLAEIIFIKLLEYEITFLTSYDYLCYFFRDKIDFISLPKKNLEIYIKEHPLNYCKREPISLIRECIGQIEKTKSQRSPIIIKKKINTQKKKKSFFFDLGNNIDESLSTSISSGYFNNNHSKEKILKYNNYKDKGQKSPLKNVIYKYIDISLEQSPLENYYNNINYCSLNGQYRNNLTINVDKSDKGKIFENFTYCKKIAQNLKYFTQKKVKKIENKHTFFKNGIKEKILRKNNISKCMINLNYSNNLLDNYNNKISSPIKTCYTKPYFKKQQSKGCFTSNKKNNSKYKFNSLSNNIYSRNKKELEHHNKSTLRKTLFFEDDDNYKNYQKKKSNII